MVQTLIPERLSVSTITAAVAAMLRTVDIAAAQDYIDRVSQAIEPMREHLSEYSDEATRIERLLTTAATSAEISTLNDRLVTVATAAYLDFRSVPLVHELCTRVRDAITCRCLQLARVDVGEAPGNSELAVIALGSDGRGEQTLATDQDYMFIYSDGGSEAYYEKLGKRFAAGLEAAGIKRCTGGVMPCNPEWRGSLQQWRRRITTMVRYDNDDWAKNVLALTILSDARQVVGPREIGAWFGPAVREAERANFRAIWNMARVAAEMPIANSIFKRFSVESDGPHRGEVNIKLNAWAPLVMCVRVLAVNAGVEAAGTLGRIDGLQLEGSLAKELATSLREAYLVITGRRILAQIQASTAGGDANYLNPYVLKTAERQRLHSAMTAVEKLQKLLRYNYSTG